MSSYSSEFRCADGGHRRDSLSRGSTRQRPILLRSSATEPSINTSNAIRGSCVSPGSPKRATDILSKVAVCSVSAVEMATASPNGMLGSAMESILMMPTDDDGAHANRTVSGCNNPSSDPTGCYFSFPSFDVWDRSKQNDEKDGYD
ncbi:hypothetical protein B0I35DRAFT_253118 [Stachybotrys elegans]|uniref:Uncharacterized protein n=1 Tax=Stachybotrys elegans TaxID=80388 RepID=A0A8K0SVG1_9HYPO|nr:hypothetical protein B0I35DRAFT_253118 [Stachybotrys elegans]